MYYISHYDESMDRQKIVGPFETYGLAAAWATFARIKKPQIMEPENPQLDDAERAALELIGKRYLEPSW